MAKPRRVTFSCPNCGEAVPYGRLACPHCGADDQTGWSNDTLYDDLDLPDLPGEYDQPTTDSKKQLWKVVAMALLILIALLVLLGIW